MRLLSLAPWLSLALALLAAPAAGADPAATRLKPEEITVPASLRYLIYLPKDYRPDQGPWPVLLFLHGSGEMGMDLEKVKIQGVPRLIAAGQDFPYIVVAPQTPVRPWNPQLLAGLLDEIERRYRVDSRRIYLTGLSMGGAGAWALAAYQPQRFAAVVPICGYGEGSSLLPVKELPVWTFHGAKDDVVPPSATENIVKALRDAGAHRIRVTIFPDANHNSWDPAYATPELWAWLAQQHR